MGTTALLVSSLLLSVFVQVQLVEIELVNMLEERPGPTRVLPVSVHCFFCFVERSLYNQRKCTEKREGQFDRKFACGSHTTAEECTQETTDRCTTQLTDLSKHSRDGLRG